MIVIPNEQISLSSVVTAGQIFFIKEIAYKCTYMSIYPHLLIICHL